MTKRQIEDIAERAGWTAAQAALAVLITDIGGIHTWWALPIATGLSALKTWIQHKLAPKGA